MSEPLLDVRGVSAGYGTSMVLEGVAFSMGVEAVGIMGRNGMGKTTLCATLMGILKPAAGEIVFSGKRIDGKSPEAVARAGIAYVPQGRRLFPSLTVDEHLRMLAPASRGKRWDTDAVYDLFPRLAERKRHTGNQLSGGEQQMLAIGRALMTNPRLLVLDEATEGLAPLIRREIWACLKRIKDEGEAILVIDKNVDALARLADRHFVIEKGRIVWSGDTPDLLATPEVKDRFLHV